MPTRQQIEADIYMEFGAVAAQLVKHPKTYTVLLLVMTVIAVTEIVVHHVF